jgi:hypothetical protein
MVGPPRCLRSKIKPLKWYRSVTFAPVRSCGVWQSYNDTLMADRTFHNPHALDEMAAYYDVLDPKIQYRCVGGGSGCGLGPRGGG